jgi:hypothetical protein
MIYWLIGLTGTVFAGLYSVFYMMKMVFLEIESIHTNLKKIYMGIEGMRQKIYDQSKLMREREKNRD